MEPSDRYTRTLAEFVVKFAAGALPQTTSHEARRALLNWLGCALGGCRDESVDIALTALAGCTGSPHAALLGRSERLDVINAAALNAHASNILDFDDTHLRTVIHPSVPVAAAALALAERLRSTGAELVHAFTLGVEVECRIGNAVSPSHYDAGWHITGTCGIFGAAAACAKLLHLDVQQTVWALGLAANQTSGTLSAHGSMTKSWNMANAARGGVTAALLASRGFTSTEHALEGERGFAAIYSPHSDLSGLVDGLGETWELTYNAYKPYPCGIVGHPIIDACLELRAAGLAFNEIERVELDVHPLVLALMGNPAPRTGLEAKLSVHHCAAAAFVRGEVGVREFSDDCTADPALLAVRARVHPRADTSISKESARIRVTTRDGSTREAFVEKAIGSLERPMSDGALEAKFRALAEFGAPACDADRLVELAWSLERVPDAGDLARATAS